MILWIKILSIFVALIILLRFKVNLSLAILALTGYTVVLFQVNAETALIAAGEALIDPRTLRLAVIIIMVLYIADVMKERDMFGQLTSSLNAMTRDMRAVAITAPAIIGFLPMPGGALVSAPMVEASTRKMNLEPEFKTFINYWFRHIWEFIWPVYAGLLIFQEYSRIPMKQIILYQSPFTLLNILFGLIIVYFHFKKRGIKRTLPENTTGVKQTIWDFFAGIWPILLVIFLFFILGIPLYISLSGVAVVLSLFKRVKPKEIYKIARSKTILKTLILILVVMIFQKIIEVSKAFEILTTMDVSKEMVVLLSFLVSFSMGFLTGVNTSFIILAYPILSPLFKIPGIDHFYMSLYVYIIGFSGILASPVHLCLVLSNEYFKASLYKVYRYLAPPVILLMIAATAAVLLV